MEKKIMAAVSDNGVKIIKAINYAFENYKHMSCFAHTIHLA